MSEVKMDIVVECNNCRGLGIELFSDISCSSETKIILNFYAGMKCPACRATDWCLIIRSARKKPQIIEGSTTDPDDNPLVFLQAPG